MGILFLATVKHLDLGILGPTIAYGSLTTREIEGSARSSTMTKIRMCFMAALAISLIAVAATTACQIGGRNAPQQLNATRVVQNAETLRLEIPDAAWEPLFFEALAGRIKQVNLPSLRTVLLPEHDLEVGFWYDARPDIINGLVIRRSDDQWSAVGIRQSGDRHFAPVEKETLGTPKSGWDASWKRLAEAGILTLPDGSKVNCQVEILDGGGLVVETNVRGTYRTYRYSNPQFAKCDEAKRIVTIEEIFSDEFGLT